MKNEETEADKTPITIEDFARLKKQLDARTSLTTVQFFTLAFGGVIVILFFGFLGILFIGEFWGSIFASVLSALAIVGMVGGMRDSNLRDHLKREDDVGSEAIDDYLEPKEDKDREQ